MLELKRKSRVVWGLQACWFSAVPLGLLLLRVKAASAGSTRQQSSRSCGQLDFIEELFKFKAIRKAISACRIFLASTSSREGLYAALPVCTANPFWFYAGI